MNIDLTQYFGKEDDEDVGVNVVVDKEGCHINIIHCGHYSHTIDIFTKGSSTAIRRDCHELGNHEDIKVIVENYYAQEDKVLLDFEINN